MKVLNIIIWSWFWVTLPLFSVRLIASICYHRSIRRRLAQLTK